MDYILNLETSALACSVSVSQGSQLIYSKQSEGEWKHSRELTLLIQENLTGSGLSINDLKAVAISGGPGSYTGLRVGASAAKGICYTQQIPLLAIDTLKIIAQPFTSQLKENGLIIPLIDARRDEVYYNIYDKHLNALLTTTNLILDKTSFAAYADKEVIVCGDGAEKAINLIDKPSFNYKPGASLAKNMAALAYEAFKKKVFEDIAYYSPFYLKPPNITKSKKQLF